jgi:hypothetical protein
MYAVFALIVLVPSVMVTFDPRELVEVEWVGRRRSARQARVRWRSRPDESPGGDRCEPRLFPAKPATSCRGPRAGGAGFAAAAAKARVPPSRSIGARGR